MSSEYIYERRAINLRGESGNYTALFVKSHSSNDGEHTPRWKLYNFSKKEDAMLYPIQCAHYCDSGLTRGIKGRHISAEFEIRAWRDAVREACLITEGDNCTFVDLMFAEKPTLLESSMETLKELAKLAQKKGAILHQFVQDKVGSPPGTKITLNLAAPKHVDLIWDAINTIKVPSMYSNGAMVGLAPHRFFDAVKVTLQQGYKYSKDPVPLDTQPEKVKTGLLQKYLGHTFHKFDFPVEGQPVYKDRRVVISNWACRVLSMDPDRWVGKALASMENEQPGCAESACRAFKRHLNALPVTPVVQIGTVEIRSLDGKHPAAEGEKVVTTESLERWQLDTVKAMFGKHAKDPATSPLYTDNVEDHLAALRMSEFVPCYIAVNSLAPA